jgi:hypothetical protein
MRFVPKIDDVDAEAVITLWQWHTSWWLAIRAQFHICVWTQAHCFQGPATTPAANQKRKS